MKINPLLLLLGIGLSCGTTAQIPDDVDLVQVFPSGSFTAPLALRHAGDGSGRFFVVQQNGIIRVVDDQGSIFGTPFLDISSLTSWGTFSEQGLLGLAFHPEFESNGLLYINHTANGVSDVVNGDTVVAEYQISGDPNVVDPTTRRNIIVIPQDFGNHNGGDIHFGPDGYLYIGMGDGGSGGDPCNRAQTLDPSTAPGGSCRSGTAAWLLGKMLRVDVNSTTPAGGNNLCAAAGDGSAEYAVPADNPYVGESDRCGEVWTYGLRNPYRFSFDRQTGDMWIGDVGQGRWEEVNFEPAGTSGGHNYGWNVCEASYATGTATPCALSGHTPPVLEYTIQAQPECAVTGGFRYRGPVASMQGLYVYADFCSRRMWFADETSPGNWTATQFGIVGSGSGYPDGLSGFGEDETGHLYMMQRNGTIWRVDGDTGGEPELELVFTTQPADAEENETLAAIVVEIQDGDGDPDSGDNQTVITLAIATGPGTLSGTTSQTVTAGVAVFGDLSIDQAGTYTLSATSDHDPALTVVSGTFEILEPGPKDDPVFDDRFEEQAP